MTRKRMIKLLMGLGIDRNDAVWAADQCNGEVSHTDCLGVLLEEYRQFYCRRLAKYVIEGDMTGAVAGMVGSVYE